MNTRNRRPIRIAGITFMQFKKIEQGRMFSIQTTLPEPPNVGQQIILYCQPDPNDPTLILTYRSRITKFISFDTFLASIRFYDIEWQIR